MKKNMLVVLLVVCNLMFIGCGHSHSWNNATYDKPKTCSSCGETEGESIKVQIENELSSGDYEFSNSWAAFARMTKDNASGAMSDSYDYMLAAKAHYRNAYELCGNYDELYELKKDIKKLLDALPTSAPSFTASGAERYMKEWSEAMNLWGEIRN